MRLVTFEVESTLGRHRRTGALSGDRVIDLSAARADQLRRNGRATGRRVAEAQLLLMDGAIRAVVRGLGHDPADPRVAGVIEHELRALDVAEGQS